MMDLTGMTLLDIYGVERKPLSGEISSADLGGLFVDEWIPFMECHKCGKSSYCKFAVQNPQNPQKKKEIKCGVADVAIRNFVERTFPLACALSSVDRQSYLDGAYHLVQFILEAEQSIGSTISTGMLDWLGEYAPSVFGRLTHLRDRLNSLSECFKEIPDLHSVRGLLLVEGWTEKAFLDKLRESHSTWFLDKLVDCYDGKGNRKSKRISMLIEKYVNLGYTIHVQGDADGNPGEIFKGLVESGHLVPDRTFVFEFDFETAVPIALLIRAMRRIGIAITFSPTELRDALSATPMSIVQILLEKYGVDIRREKMDLAIEVAEILNTPTFAWWQNEKFMNTELGRFLKFTMQVG